MHRKFMPWQISVLVLAVIGAGIYSILPSMSHIRTATEGGSGPSSFASLGQVPIIQQQHIPACDELSLEGTQACFNSQVAASENSAEDMPLSWYRRVGPLFLRRQAFDEFISLMTVAFSPDSPEAKRRSKFLISLDSTCNPTRAMFDPSPKNMQGNHHRAPKYSHGALLPMRLMLSPFYSPPSPRRSPPNASIVLFMGHMRPLHLRHECLLKLQKESPEYSREKTFFIFPLDRGPCCEGGQYFQPDWLLHHVISSHGEDPQGDWFIRPGISNQPSQSHGAPHITCHDPRKDIAVPCSGLTVTGPGVEPPEITQCASDAMQRTRLVMFALGHSAPRDYELRQKVVRRWAGQNNSGISWGMPKEEYVAGVSEAKFCLVIEGYAPLSVRLEEAVAASCVPVIMARGYRPPYADILDYSKFSITIDKPFEAVENLIEILESFVPRHPMLYCNLQLARPIFRYRLDDLMHWDDTLPFFVYSIYSTLQRNWLPSFSIENQGSKKVTTVSQAAPNLTNVRYQCEGDGKSCHLEVNKEAWLCASNRPPFQPEGNFKQCDCELE